MLLIFRRQVDEALSPKSRDYDNVLGTWVDFGFLDGKGALKGETLLAVLETCTVEKMSEGFHPHAALSARLAEEGTTSKSFARATAEHVGADDC